ncbi:hypothetical protein HK096_011242 [Nowakowskiella sp. JEL0078]|nr:hypothetical protein HK096_011242 [Nowakowskiella sp. JEL0078]
MKLVIRRSDMSTDMGGQSSSSTNDAGIVATFIRNGVSANKSSPTTAISMGELRNRSIAHPESPHSTAAITSFNAQPVINLADPETTTPTTATTLTEANTFHVAVPFLFPTRKDEITVAVGDRVRIESTFQDGWCVGVNLTSGEHGYFPQSCCVATPPIDMNKVYTDLIPLDPVSNLMTSAMPLVAPRSGSLKSKTIEDEEVMTVDYDNNTNKQVVPQLLHDSASVKRSQDPKIASAAQVADLNTPRNTPLLAIFAFLSSRKDELTLIPGDCLVLESTYEDGWGRGRKGDNEGYFPLSSCVIWNDNNI